MARRALVVIAAVLVVLFARVAVARSGGLVARPAVGVAPVELVPRAGGYAGGIVLENRGSKPLRVESLELRDGPDTDPRLPPGVEATFSDGASTALLAPGESKQVEVRWNVPTPVVARQLFGQVLFHVQDAAPLAVAFHAELAGGAPLGGHALTWLLLLPLFGVVGVAGLRIVGYEKLRALRWAGVAVALAQLALALGIYAVFDPAFTRYDGNDGFQMIERARLLPGLGVEYAVGVDGTSLALVLLVPILVLAASLWSYTIDRALVRYWTLLFVLDAALIGAFVSLDLALLGVFLLVAVGAVVWLLAGSSPRRAPAFKLATYALGAVILLAIAGVYLSGHAGTSYLLDGRTAPRTFSIIDLSHAEFSSGSARLFGYRAVKALWTALFVAFAVLAAVVPFHGWMDDAVERAPAPVALLVMGALPALGVYGMVRLLFGVLPLGTRWAAFTMMALGVASMLHAGFSALAQTELRRLVACASRFQSGVALVGLGSLTSIGIQGALAAVVFQGVTVALLTGVAGALDDRVETTRFSDLGGLARELPLFALVAAAGFAAAFAAPLSAGFIPVLMAVISVAASRPLVALLAAGALLPMALACVRAFSRLMLGDVPPRWAESPLLEPHGGRFPGLSVRERYALVPLAVLVVVLGLWPRPVLYLLDASALDHASRVNPPGPAQIVRRELREVPRLASK